MFLAQTTIAGAVDFSAADPVVTFQEELTVDPMPQDWAPRIIGYSYATSGAAHGVSLVMAPIAGAAANLLIPLETPADPVANFVQMCGRDGLVVPRRIGFEATTQPPVFPGDVQDIGTPFVLLFSTTAKQATGTFRCWYVIGPVN